MTVMASSVGKMGLVVGEAARGAQSCAFRGVELLMELTACRAVCSSKCLGCVCVVSRSTSAITSADTRNATWMMTCHMIAWVVFWSGLMKVLSRWIDEMLINAID